MSEMDRISSLPDCLLHHILSSLRTKHSVRTTILSKRWVNVWKSVPRLDLHDSDFIQVETFLNFGNSILHHKLFPNPEQLDMFNLTWYTYNKANYRTIKTWISNLLSFKPKVVKIYILGLEELSLFSCLFDCSTLEFMFFRPQQKYGGWAHFNPTVVNLPCLKKLQFGFLDFGDVFIQKIMLGCPILEELVIENSFLYVTEKISSSSLKTLIIKNNEFSSNARLRISVPSLVHLDCKVALGRISLEENLDSVEFASVALHSIKGDYEGKEVKLLKGLSNGKTIKLWGFYVKNMLEKESSDLPVFEKLESLDLGGFSINTDLEPLVSFLKRTPNLKYLALRHVTVQNPNIIKPTA